jgi:MoaA/NifB/PqqE/SkfB family radical SAM enzyme
MDKTKKLRSIQIELTARCNERCLHCYIPQRNKNRDMDTPLLMSLLDQCRDMGVEQITFSGGEPMLHPGFLPAVSKADWDGLKLRIFSNLVMLNDDMLAALKAFHIHEIQTSLYSVDPAIHDRVTQLPGSCESTKRGIERLVENNIPVFISCPLIKQNKDSYPGILAYSAEMGIGCAPNVSIMAQFGGGVENTQNRLSADEALAVIASILEIDTAYNSERFLPGYDNSSDALPCVQSIGKSAICVNADGEVLPLPAWNKAMGDLATQSLRNIWENSAELKKIRAIGLDDFPKCCACPDIQFCGMSLDANANENLEGIPFIIPGHVCDLARRMRELVHGWHGKNNTGKEE